MRNNEQLHYTPDEGITFSCNFVDNCNSKVIRRAVCMSLSKPKFYLKTFVVIDRKILVRFVY